ncbi:MAG: lytic transglycosylase domain-containing protein [Oxalicibacterium faecigallinarum]|uniref:lytic transglycosylase domain-containing protein n=1 Tax=Oxalicibacterium faecigallinarum TaxID=573741 RepID=UPI002809B607|nr:lytic transglycosylase domain-containing protein [Oxalicibacterium faecigallinarum]MDQ7968361.1 lytic transglycosylase domain-containing protein [Oxalicibacterium faecigallinarum]
MLDRMNKAMRQVANQSARQVIARSTTVRASTGNMLSTLRHAVMVLGLMAIAILTMMFFKPEVADKLQAISPFSEAVASNPPQDMPPMANLMGDAPVAAELEDNDNVKTLTAANIAPSPLIGSEMQQKRVTEWISKRYRVANDATNMLVSAAYLTAAEINLDPLLILAVMAIESRFNPFAESPVGAQGLMQVMSKVHHDKFAEMGGTHAALNPVANIRVGSLILKEYVARGGSVEAGLKRYVGAAAMADDAGYGAKVLGEYDRLKAVASGKRISVYAAMASRAAPKAQSIPASAQSQQQPDMVSTGGNVEDIGKKEKLSENLTSL